MEKQSLQISSMYFKLDGSIPTDQKESQIESHWSAWDEFTV